MIKAIETIYNGYRFRSRTEARWAVFFDALGVKYEYEKEGYDLGEFGWYLPVFWLPHAVKELADDGWGVWCEIKPLLVTEIELQKALALAIHTKHNVLIFQGACGQDECEVTKISAIHFVPPKIYKNIRFAEVGSYIFLSDEGMIRNSISYAGNLQDAFIAARSARFEHGETPVIR